MSLSQVVSREANALMLRLTGAAKQPERGALGLVPLTPCLLDGICLSCFVYEVCALCLCLGVHNEANSASTPTIHAHAHCRGHGRVSGRTGVAAADDWRFLMSLFIAVLPLFNSFVIYSLFVWRERGTVPLGAIDSQRSGAKRTDRPFY